MREGTVPVMLKLPKPLAGRIEEETKKGGYSSRQELIREVLRLNFPEPGGREE